MTPLNTRTVLVTGASGFIGQYACTQLTQQGWTVRAAVRSLDERARAPLNAHEVIALGDLTCATDQDLQRAVAGCNAVLHLAGRVHARARPQNTGAAFDPTNVTATTRLAATAAQVGAQRFVFISSIGVHGVQSRAPITETSPLAPLEPYAQSKLAAEHALQEIAARTALELVIVRPPLVYGPRCPGNLARLIHWIERGWPLPLGNIHNQRSFISVQNLAALLSATLTHEDAAHQVFVAADAEDIGLTALIKTLAQHLGVHSRLVSVPRPLLQIAAQIFGQALTWKKLAGNLQVDASKAHARLNWQPHITLSAGLRETALSFRPQHTPRTQHPADRSTTP